MRKLASRAAHKTNLQLLSEHDELEGNDKERILELAKIASEDMTDEQWQEFDGLMIKYGI